MHAAKGHLLPLLLFSFSDSSNFGLIDILYDKGLSVSYDRVLQISTEETNRVINNFENEGLVCPTVLRDGLFTTGNLDNIDHNPSSSSSKDSFHGTALSVTQHVTHDNSGIPREHLNTESHSQLKSIKPLPEMYSTVPPTSFPCSAISPPSSDEQAIPRFSIIDKDESQNQWLKKVHDALTEIGDGDHVSEPAKMNISWSAYFANLQASVPRPPAITALFPLFRDNAHSPAMVKHGMDIIKQVTKHINPVQIPVLTVDQPLYAIAKKIQWTWPNTYGEKWFVVLMGGLHIEMNILSLLGEWLGGSGWIHVMTSANVTTAPLSKIIGTFSTVKHLLYADDTQIYMSITPSNASNSIKDIQGCLSSVQSWMSANKLKLNPDKTEFIVFGNKRQQTELAPFFPS